MANIYDFSFFSFTDGTICINATELEDFYFGTLCLTKLVPTELFSLLNAHLIIFPFFPPQTIKFSLSVNGRSSRA